VPPNYDSLLAKLIVHARDREASIRRGLRALDEFAVSGMETTLPLHLAVLEDEEFRRGGVTTRFLDDRELESEGGLLRLVQHFSFSARRLAKPGFAWRRVCMSASATLVSPGC
jgi:acetyl-CoA carboxylase biotin carboxylase subunit